MFKIHGNIEDDGVIVKFVKDYDDKSHTGNCWNFRSFDWYLLLSGIEYEGFLENDTIIGHYSFQYNFFLISMNSKERFFMKVPKTKSLCGCNEKCCIVGCILCMCVCADCMDHMTSMICMYGLCNLLKVSEWVTEVVVDMLE